MNKELELWHFTAGLLEQNKNVMLLVVAESSGSSPGRQGYKMAVGADGELCGSIGGGVMEVNLVEQSKSFLEGVKGRQGEREKVSSIKEQVHRKGVANSSGMICSGKQTVIFRLLTPENVEAVNEIIASLTMHFAQFLTITPDMLGLTPPDNRAGKADFRFEKTSDTEFLFEECLGHKNDLYIVGGGHCALALSELMLRMDFYVRLFDDRPELNTLEKNAFADEIKIIDSYEKISEFIPSGSNIYVVVMTLGYKTDETVIRRLINKEFKYLGVLGSNAKMKTLLRNLKKEGVSSERLEKIHTPIGLPINSRTPEEIAISIAAQIIAVKNRGGSDTRAAGNPII